MEDEFKLTLGEKPISQRVKALREATSRTDVREDIRLRQQDLEGLRNNPNLLYKLDTTTQRRDEAEESAQAKEARLRREELRQITGCSIQSQNFFFRDTTKGSIARNATKERKFC